LTNKITEGLFDASGSLGTFSAKIDLAYSLGIYGEKTYRELNMIRKIRNEFAHILGPLNFNSPDVENRCRELWFPKVVEINHQPLAPKEARAQYLRSVNILNSLLWDATRNNIIRATEPPNSLP
jgi:DNA-binding MltR family transcriptional regulator